MRLNFLRASLLAAAMVCCSVSALASSSSGIWNNVGVCDPDAQANCQHFSAGGINGYAKTVAATVTRPTNTTTYTVNTAWANATSGATYGTLTGACLYGGQHIYLNDVNIVDEANQTLKLQGVLWLFSSAPTALNDDATFSIASSDWGNSKPPVAFTMSNVMNQGSGASGAMQADVAAGIEFACSGSDTNLYFLLQVVNAYVPISGEKLDVRLKLIGLN